jgi:BirA family biotin operon repressor/biotin-[acetyl-CoA-carboxylase] ligase
MHGYPERVGTTPVVAFATLTSTNDEALACAERGEPGPLWVVAQQQTAGRGRRGRPWQSQPGNLYASVLLSGVAPAAALPELSFVAGLALHDAVLAACPGLASARLRLKWPNDLCLDGRKLAGILIEGSAGAGRVISVIGFGVNCRAHPGDAAMPATDLAAAGFDVGPSALLVALEAALGRRRSEWRAGENFAATRAAWLDRAAGLGAPIEVRLGDRTLDGTFAAIDAAGCLVLRRPDGAYETIRAGDIFPLSAHG